MNTLKNLLPLIAMLGTISAQAGGMVLTKQARLMAEFSKSKQNKSQVTSNRADAKVLYFGGPVISNVKVIVVFWGKNVDAEVKAGIGQYYADVANSTYMDWLDADYNTNRKSFDGKLDGTKQNIGRGTLGKTITITPKNTATSLDKKAVEAEIVAQINDGKLPKPDANTLYMFHFPAGITLMSGGEASCQAWCGDHEGFNDPTYGYVYYAMMPDVGGACRFGCGFGGTTFDSMTVIASHELIESVTDPMCPDIGQSGAFPSAWLAQDQNEVGDLCADPGAPTASLVTSSKTYALQSEWENASGSCKGGTYTP